MAKKLIQVVYKVENQDLIRAQKSIRDNEKAAKDADTAIRKYGDDAKKAGRDVADSFADLENVFKGITALAVVGFFTNLTKKVIELGIKQEQLNIAFNTFLGNAEKAKKLLADLTRFSIITPFTPDQVNKAAKTLLAFGVQAEEIIPTLKMIGDVSSGTGKDLTEMAVIFGQIRSTGRLMGQDLLQLINAGFNPLQEMSEKTGISVGELKKQMEDGLITFDMVEASFKRVTSEGGLFFNLMEAQSASLGGKLSTIEGNIEEIGKALFEANNGPLLNFANILVRISGNADSVANAINRFFEAIASNPVVAPLIASLALLADATEQQDSNTENLNSQQNAGFRAAQKLGFEVSKLVVPTKQVTKGTEELTAAQKELNKEFEKTLPALPAILDGYVRMFRGVDAEVDKIIGETTEGGPTNPFVKILTGDKDKDELKDELDMLLDMSFRFLDDLLLATVTTEQKIFEAEKGNFEQRLLMAGDNERARQEIELEKLAFDQEQAKKKEEFDRQQNEKNKQAAIKKMTLDVILTGIRAAADGPPFPNLIKAGIALAFGFGQVGLAKAIGFKEGVIDLQGPGTATSDSIPAMLSKGESVMTADETARSYNLLTAIREKKIDDRVLAKASTSQMIVASLNDHGIIKAIKENRGPSFAREGYTLMETHQIGSNLKRKVRAKVGL